MARTLFVLVLLHYCSGVTSQSTLTQPASQSVSLGQRVKLSCSQSSGGRWNSFFAWYQQKAGQSPRLVIYYTSRREDGIPSRFAGSASGNVAYLTITNVQPEDGADYYCADEESSSGYKFHSVTSQAMLTQPASESVSLEQTVRLSCTKSSGGSWSSYFAWFQQKPGQSPCLVIYGTDSRADGIPDRFTGSSSGSVGYLSITNTQPEDEADYYCGDWEYRGGQKFHSGTI
ncbi:hypothetical protein lerEdw1_019477 [Lerista edwardsae]|nr:hypothetical protein lerEdw1_019477 [Lerista edwardsae]